MTPQGKLDTRCFTEWLKGLVQLAAFLVILVFVGFAFIFAYSVVTHW